MHMLKFSLCILLLFLEVVSVRGLERINCAKKMSVSNMDTRCSRYIESNDEHGAFVKDGQRAQI